MNRNCVTQAVIGVPALAAYGSTCCGQVPAGQTRNILFIISDDLKASVLPAYGDQVCKTPHLDQLAATGMVFERAYCQGLACAPSRPVMFCRRPSEETDFEIVPIPVDEAERNLFGLSDRTERLPGHDHYYKKASR